MGKMRKRGRPPDELGAKSATLSLRIQPKIRTVLAAAAEKSRRSLNREIIARLRSTFGREDPPQHITALSEMVERMALRIECVTERQFNEDRYTAEHLAKAIELLLWKYSPAGKHPNSPQTKAETPPAVVTAAKTMPGQLKDMYPDQLGVIEAGGMISSLESTAPPPLQEEHWPLEGSPESMWGRWQIREHLKPRRHK